MKTKNVTKLFEFGNPDDECLPITKCACGAKFDFWDFIIDVYKDSPEHCPKCKRKFYFTQSISILEVIDEK